MRALFHKNFQKFVKRIKDKTLFNMLKDKVDLIIKNPGRCKILEHPFRKYKVRSFSFIYKNNSYRLAYMANKGENDIVFLLIDSRENFYKKLERMF